MSVKETKCRHANAEESSAIVELSVRVQNVFTASGSLQVIGPLELAHVERAVSRHHCFVLERPPSHSTGPQLIGCALFRPLEADHFLATSDFVITNFASPWYFMGSVMLEPEYQGVGLGSTLVTKSIELLQRDQQNGTIFLDCWAGSNKLRAFYAKIGFTFAAVVPQEDYEIAIFHWSLGDENTAATRMKSTRSLGSNTTIGSSNEAH